MQRTAFLMSLSGAEAALVPGEVVRGTYTVEALLGAGAFSAVYKVRHRFLGVQAMKVFHRDRRAPNVEDVMKEAVILSGLQDPHVVRVFEANTTDGASAGWPYLTMEYAPGGTLEEHLERRVRLNPLSSLKTARQACAGLAAAHQAQPPIVHRDVKPQNILLWGVSVNGTPQVKIGDFGLAQHVDPESLMTRAAGTIHYLAPEATWGYHSPTSDVYSLAVVLYRTLTGVFPFALPDEEDRSNLESIRSAVARVRRTPAIPPSVFRLGLPRHIDGLVARALAPMPAERFNDAVEFGSALDRLIGEFTTGDPT